MCGIVGLLNGSNVVPQVVESLRRLEYRGYDSAGLAALTAAGIRRRRAEGRIDWLAASLAREPLAGVTAIGHTRWATHGRPSEANAHPHTAPRVAVVHNGIVENHQALRRELQARGWQFESETDSEVIPKLIAEGLAERLSPEAATRRALAVLRGSFAICAVFENHDGMLVAARHGSPLVVGVEDHAAGVASDALALAAWTDEAIDLEDGDLATVRCGSLALSGFDARPAVRARRKVPELARTIELGGHAHFMAKEIFEQPATVQATLAALLDARGGAQLPRLPFDVATLDRLVVVACGTSAYAAETVRPLFAELAGLPVEIEIASEFATRARTLRQGEAVLAVSQSGETADTLAAIRTARARGIPTVGLVNVAHSAIAREADAVLVTRAGTEIGVASTKAFTAQVAALAGLAVAMGQARGQLDAARAADLAADLAAAPGLLAAALPGWDAATRALAAGLVDAPCFLFMGRGPAAAIAREGALKLKETSYIPAEGIAAGELKHGTLALVDAGVPVVVVAPRDAAQPKTMSNLQEVAARGGRVILVGDREAAAEAGHHVAVHLALPDAGPLASAVLAAVPLQLLAYHVAVARGTDVDRPRNLAKSVTVE